MEFKNLIILTAANKAFVRNSEGEIDKKFNFKSVILKTVENARKFGYIPIVYDLGELGIGERFTVNNEEFQKNGSYKEIKKGYHTKSLFKPDIVKYCLNKHKDSMVYMDGDALLCDRIDEIVNDDYDVGVTLRRTSEMEHEWHKQHSEIAGYANAGVIFFNPTKAAFEFIDLWRRTTQEVENDQKALTKLLSSYKNPQINKVVNVNGVRVKYFPGDKYNYYYFNDSLSPNIKIMHFKGCVRKYYPFDWKAKIYCRTVIPMINFIWPIVKKEFFQNQNQ